MNTKQQITDLNKSTEDLKAAVELNTKLDANYGALRENLQQLVMQMYDHKMPDTIKDPTDDFMAIKLRKEYMKKEEEVREAFNLLSQSEYRLHSICQCIAVAEEWLKKNTKKKSKKKEKKDIEMSESSS